MFLRQNQTRQKNKKYHIDKIKKKALGLFLMTRKEPTEVLAVIVPPREYKDPEVIKAMEAELEKWRKFKTIELVDNDGQERIYGRWIVIRKEEHDGMKVLVRARYYLRGFKEMEKLRSDSRTADRCSNRLLYAIAGN